MMIVEYSLLPESTKFTWLETGKIIDVDKGLDYILSGIKAETLLTAWHLEMMIYRTEEIIESDSTIQPVHGEAISHGRLLRAVCESYLAGDTVATPLQIEAAFNKLADDISYRPLFLSEEALQVLAELVFVREITHHLAITAIHYA